MGIDKKLKKGLDVEKAAIFTCILKKNSTLKIYPNCINLMVYHLPTNYMYKWISIYIYVYIVMFESLSGPVHHILSIIRTLSGLRLAQFMHPRTAPVYGEPW